MRDEHRLVGGFEAAQVEPQCIVCNAADHRARPFAQPFLELRQCTAATLAVRRAYDEAPALGNWSTGSAPLPIWLNIGSTVTSKPLPSAACSAGRTRSAASAISRCGRVSSRSVVSRSRRNSGDW